MQAARDKQSSTELLLDLTSCTWEVTCCLELGICIREMDLILVKPLSVRPPSGNFLMNNFYYL